MKKLVVIPILAVCIILSGCSFLEETNDSINYVSEATDYINDLSSFVEESTSLEGEELANRVQTLQTTIEDFIRVEAPGFAEDIHQELKNKSETLLTATNELLNNGEVAIEQLQDSHVYQTIENITELMNQIENLGH
ncbi:DUF6376 family protein [Oceanobacillus picturae]|uniref:DUF6376 family protein n=1 Tax=Oceanobacillus picturae TaxID=171693 RepID=UPI000E6A6BA9|nr:DUF6376 family protein [Oceanobacillus picturae]RIU89449.1 hypothetical protein D1864_15705 [Oceanobacillus picturae]